MYKLILVDDEIEIISGLKNYFPWHDIGFEVIGTFSNGKQALNFLAKNTVDVVLTDIKMPIMDGIELIRRLKEMEYEAVFVLLSGYREFEYAKSALELGVKNYIVKPTKYSQLCDVFTKIRMELDRKYTSEQGNPEKSNEIIDANVQIIKNIKKYVNMNYREVTLEKAAEHVRLNPYASEQLFSSANRRKIL